MGALNWDKGSNLYDCSASVFFIIVSLCRPSYQSGTGNDDCFYMYWGAVGAGSDADSDWDFN